LLTHKYLRGVPAHSRANQAKSLDKEKITSELVENLNTLNEIARDRGQTLAQMALAWVLRGDRVTTALIGASSPQQVEDCAGAVDNLSFTDIELAEIDRLSGDIGINLWARSSEIEE
jgi:L-glyceraldehyde 3-phosphate reductase